MIVRRARRETRIRVVDDQKSLQITLNTPVVLKHDEQADQVCVTPASTRFDSEFLLARCSPAILE
jgi:hypothetical protein